MINEKLEIIKQAVIFDLEIKNVIDGTNITWDDKHKMGISVGVARIFGSGETMVFMDDNMNELADLLESAPIVSGFNIIGFDIPLLEATLSRKLKLNKIYDMLYVSRKSVGWSEGKTFPKGLRLNDHLAGVFGDKKTEDGADAPIFYQDKKLGRLISYCVADVHRETKLFAHMHESGWVKTETHGQRMVDGPLNYL